MTHTFKRVLGEARGSFADFSPSLLTTLAHRVSRKKFAFSVCKDVTGAKVNIGDSEACFLQDENPDALILLAVPKKAGDSPKRAEIGEECYLNPEISIGRIDGLLVRG